MLSDDYAYLLVMTVDSYLFITFGLSEMWGSALALLRGSAVIQLA
jgi:hypothetical protein